MSQATYITGDVRDVLATIPDGSVDLVMTFGGSGTTGMVATGNGRDALLIDIDERNVDLASDRIGMFLTHYTLDEWRREQAA